VVPPELGEFFLAPREGERGPFVYRPAAFASGRARFVNAKAGLDRWDTVAMLAPLGEGPADVAWGEAEQWAEGELALEKQPPPDARFAPAPGAALRKAQHTQWRKTFQEHLQQALSVVLYKSVAFGVLSRPGESERDFRGRIAVLGRERRDEKIEGLRRRYAPKVDALQDRIRRAEERVERERAEAQHANWDTALSAGAGLLGALLGGGRRSRGLGGARTALRGAGRSVKQRGDVGRAEEEVGVLQERLSTLERELDAEFRRIQAGSEEAVAETLERVEVRPRKSDISVGTIALAWVPWRADAGEWTRAV
jgi:hypothetical protein